MSCLDCDNKAKTKNEQMDNWMSQKYDEPMAVILTDTGFDITTLESAMNLKLPIKSVILND